MILTLILCRTISAAAVSADDKASRAAPPEAPLVEPAARPIAQALLDAMGGEAGLAQVGGLKFTFAFSARDTVRTSRTHWWNRRTNDYRIQLKTRDGKLALILLNLDSRKGAAWLDGQPQGGEALKKLLDRGYALFINDSYWLLMPAKLFDPGVHVALDGEAQVEGSLCDRLKITFDQVGLTPGDTYWAYVDRQSHLMTRWGMVLQDDRAKGDLTEQQYDWVDWQTVGPIRLAARKNQVGDPDRGAILFPLLSAVEAFPATVFTDTTWITP